VKKDEIIPLNRFFHFFCRRLRKMQPQQPGYGSSRSYLELLAELPWQIASEERELDLVAAKERLDSEHYGLNKVKKRIIEYLAVRKVSPVSISYDL
jgi:ATP-dependent Lon protease